ncbi:helix-turn-helix domain-containing protein [Spirillospora sp. CA-128828]|uniref:helix-turn-helix domain-containing protein n=1 Tax=Spirillospora sp. CA-128828 TaxID=3240033 RepID=UPI003D94049E
MEPLLVPLSPQKNWEGPTAAEILGVGRETIKRLIASGQLESVKHGRKRLVVVESLKEHVERLRTEQRGGEAA